MDQRTQLTFKQALEFLPNKETIHTFRNPNGSMLVGADWNKERVFEVIKKFGAELSGPQSTALGHGICVKDERGWVFIETKKQSEEK